MRFKYYLRGIGIGITFATLLLTISFYFGKDSLIKESLTDEEIIEKATALGMVMPEENLIEETEDETEDETGDEAATEAVPDEQVPASGEQSTGETEVSDEEEVLETTETKEENLQEDVVDNSKSNLKNTEDVNTTVTYIPFSVRGGESSEVVSKHLYKAGLVDSADAFNKYLAKLNLDNLVKTGTFYIKEGSSYDDIVALLVNKEVRQTSLPSAPEAPTPPEAPEKPTTPKAGE